MLAAEVCGRVCADHPPVRAGLYSPQHSSQKGILHHTCHIYLQIRMGYHVAQSQVACPQKPATLEEAVEHLVAIRLDAERKVLSAEYAAKEVSGGGGDKGRMCKVPQASRGVMGWPKGGVQQRKCREPGRGWDRGDRVGQGGR